MSLPGGAGLRSPCPPTLHRVAHALLSPLGPCGRVSSSVPMPTIRGRGWHYHRPTPAFSAARAAGGRVSSGVHVSDRQEAPTRLPSAQLLIAAVVASL